VTPHRASGLSRRKRQWWKRGGPNFSLNHGKVILPFSALLAVVLGDLRDLSLCFPQSVQNPKTQRPPRASAEFAEKNYLAIRPQSRGCKCYWPTPTSEARAG
jgi:hypothetical protein